MQTGGGRRPQDHRRRVRRQEATATITEAYELIVAVAAGHLDSVDDIAARLKAATEDRS
jgi:hypothetical protein